MCVDKILVKQEYALKMCPEKCSTRNASSNIQKQIWLNDCSDQFKPVYFKRYVDDIFVLFRFLHYIEKFHEHLNTKHANTKFANENKVSGSLLFFRCVNIMK